MGISYSRKIQNNYFLNKTIVGLFGEMADTPVLIKNIERLEINAKHRVKALIGREPELIKALGLNNQILKQKVQDLSQVDAKCVSLIKTIMLKPELIILNNFEKGVNAKVLTRMIRFIKTIQATFNIKFIIISNDPLFLSKISKDIIIMKQRIIKYQGPIMPALKQNLLPQPEILKFIDLANEKGADLDYSLEEKEVLKSIYRSIN